MSSHEPSIAELRASRERAWQRLRAAVPLALKAAAEHKAELEARINACKNLSKRDQRELEKIRALLNRVEQAKVCALLNRMDLDKIQDTLRERAVATEGTR